MMCVVPVSLLAYVFLTLYLVGEHTSGELDAVMICVIVLFNPSYNSFGKTVTTREAEKG